NVNDGVIDITSTTGGAGGPYTFRLNGVAASEPFTNLPGGTHTISMIDNTGCRRDTTITVAFPGFVAYASPATTIDATCTTKGTIGIFIPNPPGSYEIGFTTNAIAEPTNYNANFYNPATGLVFISNLSAGTYYVWIRTSAAACPTRFIHDPVAVDVYAIVIGGPQPISFEVGCRSTDGVLQLNNIAASSADPISYEIFGNGFQKSGSISPNAMAQDTIHGFVTGDYVVWLRQDQSTFGCTVYSDTLAAPSGALDTISVAKNVSFPESPTGSVRVKIQESGAEPYEAWLVETGIPVTDTLTAVRNPVNFEVNFTSLAAATYELFIEDAAGCRKAYSIVLPFDSNIFIPNVFTPNGDDKNETFYVRNLPESGSKLSITNRWGKEVYSSNNYNPSNLWDGGSSPDGVYYYRLQINGGGTYTGWVEIVRGVKP
ncbi:MAG TPA: gliding motility-associated C-terminal domain-containing protein, partial [Cyclobacteriaceae bacterium]|nr:gliding motility-associated C-terminal domain-containing protein [Cyclobacteriaceae bacterium]